MVHRILVLFFITFLAACLAASLPAKTYDVMEHGAVGDGRTLDTAAINKAIEAASENGGGIVYFPAGKYLSHSIHLKSHTTLYLSQGASILAAEPTEEAGRWRTRPDSIGLTSRSARGRVLRA